MSISLGLLVTLEAKPGRGPELGAFLEEGRVIAAAESGTVTWYAFRISESTFGVFDTFNTAEGRQAHLDGEIPRALARVGSDLLVSDPDIRLVDVLAVK